MTTYWIDYSYILYSLRFLTSRKISHDVKKVAENGSARLPSFLLNPELCAWPAEGHNNDDH